LESGELPKDTEVQILLYCEDRNAYKIRLFRVCCA